MSCSSAPSTPLWDCFAVIALPHNTALQTVQGEIGFLGSDQRYKPHLVDSLPCLEDAKRLPPPQLPTCCLPAGVDIILQQDLHIANLTPRSFSVILTEGDGTKVYASCLTFYDCVPHELCAKHEDLLGAKALKAICLLSHQPYLASTDKVLREFYHMAFLRGCSVPLPELISSLLAVPSPQQDGHKVCLNLGCSRLLMWPPLADVGPPPGELSLQPLLEALKPDNLVGLFAAVLLEQRVLLRSRQHWLLTVVAEGIVRLLYPLRYQHVYIPVVPYSLTDYLEAPTPFLMGLHSEQYVDPKLLEVLVVADLDNDSISFCKDDSLLKRSLGHPYMQQLRMRVRMLVQPSLVETDAVGQFQDPWMLAAQKLSLQSWGPQKQELLLQVFLEFFRSVLSDYRNFVSQQQTSTAGIGGQASDISGQAGGALSSSSSSTQMLLQHQHSGMLSARGAGPGISAGGSCVSDLAKMLSVGRTTVVRHQHQHSHSMDLKALLKHHQSHCRHTDPALLQQLIQGLPFLSFAAEDSSSDDPMGWLKTAQASLRAWRVAEESLQATDLDSTMPQADGDSEVCSTGEGGSSLRLRRRISATSGKKRPSAGKRRAISELMGFQGDLRRTSQSSASINTDSPLPPWLRSQVEAAAVAAPGLPNLAKVSNSSSTANSCLSLSYSAEADLVRRQTALLVQLMQPAVSSGSGSDSDSGGLSSSDLDAAKTLLCVQTGGNGWFLVSRMKDFIIAGSTHSSSGSNAASNSSSTPSTTDSNAYSNCPSSAASITSDNIKHLQASEFSGARTSVDATSLNILTVPGSASIHHFHLAASSSTKPNSREGDFQSGNVTPSDGSTSTTTTTTTTTSSSSSKIALPGALKVELMVNAASAMACHITKTASGAKQKLVAGSGSSYTAQGSTEKIAAARPSASALNALDAVAVKDEEKPCANSRGINSSSSSSLPVSGCTVWTDSVGACKSVSVASAASSTSNNSQSASDAALAGSTGRCLDWRVSSSAFQVLGHMLNSILDVASHNEDFRVVLAVLELSCLVTCLPEKPAHQGWRQSLLSSLAGNPAVHCQWFWAGTFSFAISSLYLQAQELTNIRDVVALCLAHFVRYVTGVGISGISAWLLLMQLAAEHTAHLVGLDPEALVNLRAHLAHQDSIAHQELLGLPGPMPGPALTQPGRVGTSRLGAAAACAAAAGMVSVGFGTAGLAAADSQLPEHVVSGLKACGLEQYMGQGEDAVAVAGSGILCREAAMLAATSWQQQQQQLMCSSRFVAYHGHARAARPLQQEEAEEEFEAQAALAANQFLAEQPNLLRRVQMHRNHTKNTSISGNSSSSSSSSSRSLLGTEVARPLLATALGLPCPGAAAAGAGCITAIPAPVPTATAAAPAVASAASSPLNASIALYSPQQAGSPASATTSAVTNPAMLAVVPAAAADHSPRQVPAAGSNSSSRRLSPSAKLSPRSGGPSPRTNKETSPRDIRPVYKMSLQASHKSYSSIRRHSATDPAAPGQPQMTPGCVATNTRSSPAAAAGAESHNARQMQSGSFTTAAAAAAAVGATAGETAAAAAAAAIQVNSEGMSLAQPGSLQWAAIHGQPVVALAASNYVATSVSLDGTLKVINTSGSHLQLTASMIIPALQASGSSNSTSSSCAAAPRRTCLAALPVLRLWQDGTRAAVGNAHQQAVWVVDLQGCAASVELSGLGSSVTALQLLHRNRDTLLVGLGSSSTSCHHHSSSSSSSTAVAYLWDLRRPRKPATSLDAAAAPVAVAAASGSAAACTTATTAAGDVAAYTSGSEGTISPGHAAAAVGLGGGDGGGGGAGGVLGFTVHDDGVLAAAGCRDGRSLVWDMRQPAQPLAVCAGHSGPVRQVRFLPPAASSSSSSSSQQLLLTGSDDWTARLWDASSGSCQCVCVGHGGGMTAVQLAHSTSGTRLVTGAADGTVGVWGLQGQLCSLTQQHWAPVQLLAQGVDTLVSGASDKTCCVWSLSDVLSCHLPQQPPLLACQPRHALVCSMAYDPVAELLCSGHRDGLVSVWNCSYSTSDESC